MSESTRLFHPLVKVIKGVTWQTEGSTMIASQDDILLGKWVAERYLFRTPHGHYFEQYHAHGGKLSAHQIHPLETQEALKRYSRYERKYLALADAFPDVRPA